jgi:hypothetical protein
LYFTWKKKNLCKTDSSTKDFCGIPSFFVKNEKITGTSEIKMASATAGRIPWIIPTTVGPRLLMADRGGNISLSVVRLARNCTKTTFYIIINKMNCQSHIWLILVFVFNYLE